MAPTESGPPLEDPDDLLSDIDWVELQEFFLDHLKTQLEEMKRGLESGDLDALSRIGHSIKGSGAGVHLPHFTELGRVLEDAGKAGDLEAVRDACRDLSDQFVACRAHEREAMQGYFDAEGQRRDAA